MKTVTHADGSWSYHTGGVVFGPYGPDKCPATHHSGEGCKHWRGHGGCHGTFDKETPAGTMKHRWSNNPIIPAFVKETA
jgi:hypothetical protein